MADPKSVQEAEARARASSGVDSAENSYAAEGADIDPAPVDPGSDRIPRTPVEPKEPPRGEPKEPPPYIAKRNEIIARYREGRVAAPEEGNVEDFSDQSALPEEFRTQPAEPAGVETTPETQVESQPIPDELSPAPRTYKVKVHGQEKEITEEELVAKAQIAMASENILEEVKGLKKDLTERLSRVEGQRPHQPQQPAAQPPNSQSPDGMNETAIPDQDDPIAKLIETIQYGNPAEAKTLLQDTIARAVIPAVEHRLQIQRLQDEGARTAKVLTDFKAKHAEIAADPLADAAIQTRMYQLQVKDIEDLGVDPKQIQTQSGVVTPADIAMAHRWYRANGFNVQKPEDLLDQAVKDFLTWKGVAPKPTSPAEPAPANKAAPRVEIAVDRNARRAAIPQQPERAAAPQPAPQRTAAPQPRDRSDIVQSMAKSRSLPRGKVGVA
jgi:hypothetical protein